MKRWLHISARTLCAVFFIVAGLNHFRDPATYLGMMPPWVPWPGAANILSGAAEVLGGIGLLMPSLRRVAGWVLIAVLVAVFPANLHVAMQGHMPGYDFSPTTLWWRLPFQAAFIAWVGWVAFSPRKRTT